MSRFIFHLDLHCLQKNLTRSKRFKMVKNRNEKTKKKNVFPGNMGSRLISEVNVNKIAFGNKEHITDRKWESRVY